MNSTSNIMSSLTGSASDSIQIGMAHIAAGKKNAPITDAKAEATGKDFESMFLSQMLEQMFGESTGEESFGDSETNEIYRSMMVSEYAKQITNAGGIGIASTVKQELLKTQEV